MGSSSLPQSPYQVGGSLPLHSSSYVIRQADQQLYQALMQGEFCYVFNARQMGKSSLRVQTMQRLAQAGVRCAAIDLTTIGTQQVTMEQWYASLAAMLTSQFQLPIKLGEWWRSQGEISWIGRLRLLIETVLFEQVRDVPIVIFIDEADSVLGLPFETDDFFAFIRSCYNQRAENDDYRRLSFVLLGVATPSTLMHNKTMTPFNIGLAIELGGFQLVEAMPLAQGLEKVISNPRSLLGQILAWTGGQPFLTQKLCTLALQYLPQQAIETQVQPDQLSQAMAQIVTQRVIQDWESQDEPEHLRTIRDRILHDPQQAPRLLSLYQKLLLSPQGHLHLDNSPEQRELLLSGLLHPKQGVLQVKNPIYEAVFNLDWIDQQLVPFTIVAGLSNDLSPPPPLLEFGAGTSISDPAIAPVTPVAIAPANLANAPRSAHPNRWLIIGWLSSLILLGGGNLWQGHQLRQTQQQQMQADSRAASALAAQKDWQPALFHALRAYQTAQAQPGRSSLAEQNQLQTLVYQAVSADQLRLKLALSDQAQVTQASFHPNEQQVLVSEGSMSGQSKHDRFNHHLSLWQRNGTLLHRWAFKHQALAWNPQGNWLISLDAQQNLKRWAMPQQPTKTLSQLDKTRFQLGDSEQVVRRLIWDKDGNTLLLAQPNGQIQLRTITGKLAMTIKAHTGKVHGLISSPTQQQFVSGGDDRTIRFWQIDGQALQSLPTPAPILDLAFSQDGRTLASLLEDRQVWIVDEQSHQFIQKWSIPASNSPDRPTQIAINPRGNLIAITTIQGNIHLHQLDGTPIAKLPGDNSPINSLAFSPEGNQLLSASQSGSVYLWDVATARQPKVWLTLGCTQLHPYLQNQPDLLPVDRQRCDAILAPGQAR